MPNAVIRYQEEVNYTEIKLSNVHESTNKSLNRDERLSPNSFLLLSRNNFKQKFSSTVNILQDDS
jgi:hypothetical protein